MAFFKTTEEVTTYLKLDVNMKFLKLLPSIVDAEDQYIKPLLGDAFYEELKLQYDGGSLSPDNVILLPYIQRPLAYYAMVVLGDELGVNIGDLGIQQAANLNSQPAPQQKVSNLKFKYITSADRTADALLEFLEKNATGGKYAAWFNDPNANTVKSGLIVYKTSIASKYIDINESRRVYLRLRKRIVDIEKGYVGRLLCSDQYAELVEQIKLGTLTDKNKALVEKLEPFISKKALYLTLPSIAIAVEAEGLVLFSSNDSVVSKEVAGTEEKKMLASSLREGDFGYEHDEQALIGFLNANIDDYPLVKNSPCWENNPASSGADTQWRAMNSPCFKHYST